MSKTVDSVRKQIDSIDDAIHDLLMKRAGLVLKIGEEKRKNNIQVVQPDREALMLRRLLDRHEGPLPREAIVRIWRELVGAVSLLQTGLKVVVTVPEGPQGLIFWDMAKDYFSSVLPMVKSVNPLGALANVREAEATFAVLPWPENDEENPWWCYLMDELLVEDGQSRAMRIMARLPLGDRSRAEENPEHRALVVARVSYETSGADRSFIAVESDDDISRARLMEKAQALGLPVRSLYTATRPQGRVHLAEINDYVAADDDRLGKLMESLDVSFGRCLCLGGYPVPPVYGDQVGKNAVKA